MIEAKEGIGTYCRSREGNETLMLNGKATNFRVQEFACHDGSDEILIDRKLITYLQVIRDYFQRSVLISSGYRSPAYNSKVGGAPQSFHKKGMAADIVVGGISPLEVAMYAQSIRMMGIGWYNSTTSGFFTHVDTRTAQYFWYNASGNAVNTYLPVLRLGNRGDSVMILQKHLNLAQDGKFGFGTRNAVKAFQRTHGLTADGIVGVMTWAKIFE